MSVPEVQPAFWEGLPAAGDRPALIGAADGTVVTHAQLAAHADRIADAFGVARQKRMVVVLARNDADIIAAYLAALRSGDAVLPFGQDIDSALLATLAAAHRPDLIVFADASDQELPAWAADYGVERHGGLTLLRRRQDGEIPPHPDLAVLLTTSGSTGNPKLVRLSHQALAANARQIVEALRMTPDDRAITSLSMAYSFGLSVLNSHLLCGGSLALTDLSPLDTSFWDVAAQAEITTFPGVPFTYDLLRRTGAATRTPASLNKLLQAGGRMNPQMIQWTRQSFAASLFVMYGQTEATARIAVLPPEDAEAGHGSVGYPLAGGRLELDGDGQVLYHGPNVMMGYALERADLARGDDLAGVLATGDLGRIDADGRLWLTGRISRIAKPFGVRVNLDDMEKALSSAGVLAVGGDDSVISIVVESGELDDIRARARILAADLKLPPSILRIRTVDKLPRSANGKILYAELPR